jgi:hypothetical protein
MVVLSLVPQIELWVTRGHNWNGAYVSPQGDEPIYSAYINALIQGRPRKNDPFGGRDDVPTAPLPESHFSIQFIPAYAIAFPARVLGISASTAFILLLPIAVFLSSATVFGLVISVNGNHRIGAVGTLFVLCSGWIVGRYGIFNTFFDIGIPALHFIRRYQPALAFPLFFAFQFLVWRALHSETTRARIRRSLLAGGVLATLIFSYLYLWTGAAAWLGCVGCLWLYFRPAERRKAMSVVVIIGVMTALALIPYFRLLYLRAVTLDDQQLLISTHAPDFFRMHELLGAAILLLLFLAVRRKKIKWHESQVLYATSVALLPFVLFNQQVLTGTGIQPFHYEIFVVNYSAMAGLLIAALHVTKPESGKFLFSVAALSIAMGIVAVVVPARLVFVSSAVRNDERIPVLRRLNELSQQDGTISNLRTNGQASTVVFSPSVSLITLLPTWTSQPTLLDLTGADCRALTRDERKNFFAMHLYYSHVDIEAIRRGLNGDRKRDELLTILNVTFGYERTAPALTSQFRPIEEREIEREVAHYQKYIQTFSREEALRRPLSYAVIPADGNFDFTNLDRWYQRDAGERVGAFVLYRLSLRPA